MATVKRSRSQVRFNSISNQRKGHATLRRTLLASTPVVAALIAGHQAWGATDTWVGLGVDNNWKDPANWAGNSVPAPNDTLDFTGANRLQPNNNFTAGTFFVGGFIFDSAAAGPFSLVGNSVQLNGNITDNTQSFTQTIVLPMTLDVTTTVSVTQNGSLLLSGAIAGSGFGLSETGLGVLTLSGTNTFTGPVTVGNGATLAITTDLNLGAAPSSATPSDLVLDGGSLLSISGSSFTLNANRGITITNAGGMTPASASISVATGQNVTYAGIIADGGTAGGLTKMSFGSMTLTGANTYTGPTTISNGFITADFSQAGAPASNIISSSSALVLGGSTAGLGDTSYAQFFAKGANSTVNSQTFNGTTIAIGPAVITATSGTSGTVNISLGSLTDTTGGVVVFAPAATGNISTTATNTNGILGGWAVIGSVTTGNNVRNGVIMGTNYATVNGSGNIVAYTGYTDYGTAVAGDTGGLIPTGTALNGNVTSSTNLRINANSTIINAFVNTDNAGTTTDLNTLSFVNSVNGTPGTTVSVGAGNTLRFGVYGGIFRQDIASNATIYIGGLQAGGNQTGNGSTGSQGIGTITAGGPVLGTPGQLVFTVDANNETSGTILVEPTIADNGVGGTVTVIKTGAGSMKLDGHNTFSGGLDILSGRLQFAGNETGTPNPDGGGTGPIRVFPGAQWFPSGAGSATSPGTITNPIFLAGIGIAADDTGAIRGGPGINLSGTITLFGNARIGGGGLDYVNSTTGANAPGFLISGQITGNFSMDFGAIGNAGSTGSPIWISNPNNNWTGNTTIVGRSGTAASNTALHLAAANVIPNGLGYGNVVMGITTNTVAENVTLDLDGNNQTINGLSSNLPNGSATSLWVENDLFYYPVGGSGNTAAAPTGVATAPDQATLTLGNNNQTATFAGVIRDTTANPTTLTGTVGGVSYNYIQTGNTMAIVKIGAGVETLSGANTYTGNTTINGGAISVTGSLLSTGNVNVNTSASTHGALFGTGSVGNVTLAASTGSNNAVINPGAAGVGSVGKLTAASVTVNTGGDLQFDTVTPGASDSLSVTGALSFAGASTISPGGGGATGTYTLITAGSITGTEPTLISPSNTRSVFSYDPTSWNPISNASATSIVIDIVTHAANLVWTGAGDGSTWDIDITKNWFNTGTAAADFFFNGDNVTFDDTANPNYNVNLPGNNVSPNSIVFNNTSGTYSITGTGVISGGTGIVKNGIGTVSIGTNNTFTGAVSINAGRININNFGALGMNTTTGTTIAAGAALDISGDTTVNDVGFGAMPFTIAGTGTDGNGVIVNNGVAQQNAFTSISLTGDATLGGSGRLDIRSPNSTLNLNGHTLTKVGTDQFSLVNTSVSSGSIIVNAGELSIEGTSGMGSDGNFITLNTNTTLQFFNLTGGINRTIAVNGTGVIIGSNTAANTTENIGSAIVLSDPVTIGTLGGSGTLQLSGIISETGGAQSITKTGANVLYMPSLNTYSGGTTISAGALELGNSTNITTTITNGPVGLGTLTLASGATLEDDGNAHSLANNVSVGGNVTFDAATSVGGGITLDGTSLAIPATVTFTANSVMTVNTVLTINDAISGGASNISVATANTGSPGVLVLGSANNSWSGTTTIRSGTIQLLVTGALPSGTSLTLGNAATSGTLDLGGANATVGGLTTSGTGTTNQIGNSSTVSNSTLTFAGGTSTFGGAIVNTLGGGNMTTALAVSSGSLTLSGNNNAYAGGTVINGGTLRASNTSGSATGTGNITMNGGILASGVAGSVSGNVLAGSGAHTIAPGGVGAIGTLTVGGLTSSSLSTLNFDLGTGTGPEITSGDLLTLGSGTVSIASGTAMSFGGTSVIGDDYRLIGDLSSGAVVGAIPLAHFSLPAAPAGQSFSLSASVDPGFIDLVVSSGGPATLVWNNAGGDNLWNTGSSNWNNGSSNTTYSDGSQVTFNDNNPSNTSLNYNVTLNAAVSPASVTVNNSNGNYVVSGTGSIAGTTALSKSGTGNLTLDTVNTYTGGTNVSAGTLVVGVHGALPSGVVNITGGTLELAPSTGLATVSSLSISGSGTFDVSNNHIIINYGSGSDPIAAIKGYLLAGFNNGGWNGTSGIVSSAVAATVGTNAVYGLGYADALDPGNPAGLASGTIEVEYTLLGDADLNRTVNGIDFGILAANFNKTVTAWDQGDFDYNGIVNGIDFTTLASNFNKATSGASAGATPADFAALEAFAAANGLIADVPEPASMAMLAVATAGILHRRRRKPMAR
jgi:autotransporter-associated beta strand protein